MHLPHQMATDFLHLYGTTLFPGKFVVLYGWHCRTNYLPGTTFKNVDGRGLVFVSSVEWTQKVSNTSFISALFGIIYSLSSWNNTICPLLTSLIVFAPSWICGLSPSLSILDTTISLSSPCGQYGRQGTYLSLKGKLYMLSVYSIRSHTPCSSISLLS